MPEKGGWLLLDRAGFREEGGHVALLGGLCWGSWESGLGLHRAEKASSLRWMSRCHWPAALWPGGPRVERVGPWRGARLWVGLSALLWRPGHLSVPLLMEWVLDLDPGFSHDSSPLWLDSSDPLVRWGMVGDAAPILLMRSRLLLGGKRPWGLLRG